MGNGYGYDDTNTYVPGGPGGGGFGGAPPGGYGAPPGGYGAPPGGYGAPPAPAAPGGYAGYDDYDDYPDDDYGAGSHPAVHWGLVCGIVLAVAMIAPFLVLEIAYPYYFSHPQMVEQSLAAKQDLGTNLAFVFVLLASVIVTPVSLFLAGFLTTRETGTVGSGAFAGALAGGVGFIVYIFGSIFLTVVQHQTVPWDQVPAVSHVLIGLAAGTGFLAGSCCNLLLFTLPPALIATAGAMLARLIWGPAQE